MTRPTTRNEHIVVTGRIVDDKVAIGSIRVPAHARIRHRFCCISIKWVMQSLLAASSGYISPNFSRITSKDCFGTQPGVSPPHLYTHRHRSAEHTPGPLHPPLCGVHCPREYTLRSEEQTLQTRRHLATPVSLTHSDHSLESCSIPSHRDWKPWEYLCTSPSPPPRVGQH